MKVLPSGVTSRTEYFNLLDKTAGTPKTGVTITQLLIGYTRTRQPNVTTTLSALPNTSAAFSSGGAIEVDGTNAPGLYRVDVPNAAFSTQSGVDGVILTLYAATTTLSVAAAMKEVQLDAIIASVTGNVGGAVGSVVGGVGGSVAGTVNSVVGNVGGSVGSVVGGVGGTVALVTSVTGSVGGSVGSVTGNVGGSVGSVVGNVGGSVGSVVGNIGGSVSSVANAVLASSVVGGVGGNVAGSVGSVVGGVGGSIAGSVNSVVGNVGGSVGSVVGNVGGSVSSVATSVLASSVTGNVGGSVGSVVGNVGGSVASVVGNVGGSVNSVVNSIIASSVTGNVGGSVGSVNNTVTASVSTNNDKTGYSLTADFRIKKNTALNAFPFVMINSTDHITPQTSLTVSATRSLDGSVFGNCANTVAEVGSGVYKIDLAAGDLNADTVTLRFAASGADDRLISLITQTE